MLRKPHKNLQGVMIKAFKINISLSALIFKNSILSKNSTTLLKKPDNYILRTNTNCDRDLIPL